MTKSLRYHQDRLIQQTERMSVRSDTAQQKPERIPNSQRSRQKEELRFGEWRRQKKTVTALSAKKAAEIGLESSYNNHTEEFSVDEEPIGDPTIHVSSSQIHESYFDDEMQARVTRSARQRQRQLSQRSRQRDNELDNRSQLERAVSQTSRVMSRIGTFFKNKFSQLREYLYEEVPRLSKRNKIMQAPLDDSIMMDQRDNKILSFQSRLGSIGSDSSASDKSLNNENNQSYGSDGFKTAWSRSRSVRNTRSKNRAVSRSARISSVTANQPHLSNVRHNQVNLKEVSPKRMVSTVRSTSRQVRFPREPEIPIDQKMEINAEELSQTEVSMKNTSVQVDPLPSKGSKSKKKKKRTSRVDLSKRSIGVGSLCIDDTVCEISRIQQTTLVSIGSGSTLTKAKTSQKRSKINEIVVPKKYLSSDDEKQQSQVNKKNENEKDIFISQIPHETLMHAQNGFQKTEVKQTLSQPQNKPQLSSQKPSQSLPYSQSLVQQSQNILQKEQLDNSRLNRVDSPKQPHSEYRLETYSNQSKLSKFYEKLAEHEKLSQSISSEEKAPVQISRFNPEEQDEENYQFHNSNLQFFNNSDVEEIILSDLHQECLENISDCSFIPGYYDKKKISLLRNASQISQNQLDKGQFVLSSASMVSNNLSQIKTTQPMLSTCLTSLMSYQSDSEVQKRRIKLPRLPTGRKQSPVMHGNQFFQHSEPKIDIPAPKSPKEQLLLNLFSEEKESQRLKNRPHDFQDQEFKDQTQSEPPSELFFMGNETIAIEKEEVLKKAPQQTVISTPRNKNNQRYGDQSQTFEDLTLVNFDLTKDVSQSIYLGCNLTISQQPPQTTTPFVISEKEAETSTEIFPPQNLRKPIDEDSHSLIARFSQKSHTVKKGVMPDILDELDTISRIQADEEVDDREGPLGTPSIEIKELVIPPVEVCSFKEFRGEVKGPKTDRAMPIEFYGGGSEKASNGEDAEVVIHQAAPETDEDLDPSRLSLLKKQNRSTTAALQSHFLSSASEDDEEGNNTARRKRQMIKGRTKIKGVVLAAMHSSVNNGAKDSRLPLYGQRRAPNQKSINQITFQRSPDPAANKKDTPEMKTQASETQQSQKSMSVSERFKASLKAFKTNTLIKNGGNASTASVNSSKLSVAILSQKSATTPKE